MQGRLLPGKRGLFQKLFPFCMLFFGVLQAGGARCIERGFELAIHIALLRDKLVAVLDGRINDDPATVRDRDAGRLDRLHRGALARERPATDFDAGEALGTHVESNRGCGGAEPRADGLHRLGGGAYAFKGLFGH